MTESGFSYNGHSSNEYGLIIATINNEVSADGGDIEVVSIQSPDNDRYTYYGEIIPTSLSWNFEIAKNPCEDEKMVFTVDEERHIAKWLLGTKGYCDFYFVDGDYSLIHYNAKCTHLKPVRINNQTIGFELTISSDCGYGFSEPITLNDVINIDKSLHIQVNNDLVKNIDPTISLKTTASELALEIYEADGENETLVVRTRLYNIIPNQEIVLDCRNDIITGLRDENPNNFNWLFPYFVDGANVIKVNTETDVNIKIKYQENRRVIYE